MKFEMRQLVGFCICWAMAFNGCGSSDQPAIVDDSNTSNLEDPVMPDDIRVLSPEMKIETLNGRRQFFTNWVGGDFILCIEQDNPAEYHLKAVDWALAIDIRLFAADSATYEKKGLELANFFKGDYFNNWQIEIVSFLPNRTVGNADEISQARMCGNFGNLQRFGDQVFRFEITSEEIEGVVIGADGSEQGKAVRPRQVMEFILFVS